MRLAWSDEKQVINSLIEAVPLMSGIDLAHSVLALGMQTRIRNSKNYNNKINMNNMNNMKSSISVATEDNDSSDINKLNEELNESAGIKGTDGGVPSFLFADLKRPLKEVILRNVQLKASGLVSVSISSSEKEKEKEKEGNEGKLSKVRKEKGEVGEKIGGIKSLKTKTVTGKMNSRDARGLLQGLDLLGLRDTDLIMSKNPIDLNDPIDNYTNTKEDGRVDVDMMILCDVRAFERIREGVDSRYRSDFGPLFDRLEGIDGPFKL